MFVNVPVCLNSYRCLCKYLQCYRHWGNTGSVVPSPGWLWGAQNGPLKKKTWCYLRWCRHTAQVVSEYSVFFSGGYSVTAGIIYSLLTTEAHHCISFFYYQMWWLVSVPASHFGHNKSNLDFSYSTDDAWFQSFTIFQDSHLTSLLTHLPSKIDHTFSWSSSYHSKYYTCLCLLSRSLQHHLQSWDDPCPYHSYITQLLLQ